MDIDAYLERIGLQGPIDITLDSLEKLQRAHLTAVPFENLDVFARRGVQTDDLWTVAKVVERRRGGWCFELNGAFSALLTAIGYPVRRVAADVLYGNEYPMPTHHSIEVTLDRPYLVDVGFGDSFIRPLPLDSPGPHDGGSGSYGFIFEEGATTLVSHEPDGSTLPHFRWAPRAHRPQDFAEASTYLQVTPGLRWTEARFATRLLDGGPDRVTLLGDRIKFRRDGEWTERPVTDEEWPDLLQSWFGMTP